MRQQEIQYAEDPFLDLPCIAGAADQDSPIGKIDNGKIGLACAMFGRISQESRSADHSPFRSKIFDLIRMEAEEHIIGK